MPTLAQVLEITTPVSPLLRKARRLGLSSVGDFISVAVARGCRHYAAAAKGRVSAVSTKDFSNEELIVLLLVGENPYEATALRCAAQLVRSPAVSPVRLAQLARMEKVERSLWHIVRAGLDHDPQGRPFWQSLAAILPVLPERQEPNLPHWSRFVSMPGRQRDGRVPIRWLIPSP